MLQMVHACFQRRATQLVGLFVLITASFCSVTNAQEPEPAQVAKPSPSSTAERLTASQRAKKIFGVKTPGAALPSTIEVLPNGDRFQYAFANYISANGQPLEGNGVVPDVETPWTRVDLLEGRDPAVEAALCWIRSSQKTR